MATSPARQPFRIMLRSGLPRRYQAAKVELTAAAAAAVFVVTAMRAMSPAAAAIVLPGLKPNHPNQSTSTPSVADVML
jgi:hypothetical protein